MSEVIALFESSRAVIKCERLCKANSIYCKIIPVPRHISSECGMALEVHSENTEQIELLCRNAMIGFRFEILT